jgi:ribosome-associated protein
MEENLYIREGVTIPGGELGVTASRSGGPGGQNVNKVSSRVTLRWNLRTSAALDEAQKRLVEAKLASRITADGELVIHADKHRSQYLNRESARARLAVLVREALRIPVPRIPTRPSRGAKRRRLAGKKRRAEVKRSRREPGADD